MTPPLLIAAVVSVFDSAALAQEDQFPVLFANGRIIDEGVHRAIEDGRIVGPRTCGSDPIVGQTSGLGDLRQNNDPHPHMVGRQAAIS